MRPLMLTCIGFALSAIVVKPIHAASYLKIDSSPAAYGLTRSGKPVEVQDGMYLKAGDRVEIKNEGAHVQVVTGTGKLIPLEVPPGGKTLGAAELGGSTSEEKVSQTWKWASDWLLQRIGAQTESVSNARIVQAASRAVGSGESLSIPMANQGGLRMISQNKRPLVVAWSGGKGPFKIEIKNPEGTIVIRHDGAVENHFRFDAVSFTPGLYSLVVSDQIETIETPLTVVSRGNEPSEALKSTKSDQETLAGIIKLSTRQQGWAFESYQQASLLSDRMPFAKVFTEALEIGDIPEP